MLHKLRTTIKKVALKLFTGNTTILGAVFPQADTAVTAVTLISHSTEGMAPSYAYP